MLPRTRAIFVLFTAVLARVSTEAYSTSVVSSIAFLGCLSAGLSPVEGSLEAVSNNANPIKTKSTAKVPTESASAVVLGQRRRMNHNALLQVEVAISVELLDSSGKEPLFFSNSFGNSTASLVDESRNFILTIDELAGIGKHNEEESTELAAKGKLQMEHHLDHLSWVLRNKNTTATGSPVLQGGTTLSLLLPLDDRSAAVVRTVAVAVWEDGRVDRSPTLLTRRLANLPRATLAQPEEPGSPSPTRPDNPVVKVQLEVSTRLLLPTSHTYDAFHDTASVGIWMWQVLGFAVVVSVVWFVQVQSAQRDCAPPKQNEYLGVDQGLTDERNTPIDFGSDCEDSGIHNELDENDRDNMSYEEDACCSSDCDSEYKITRPPKLVRRSPAVTIPQDLCFLTRSQGTVSSPSKRVLWKSAADDGGEEVKMGMCQAAMDDSLSLPTVSDADTRQAETEFALNASIPPIYFSYENQAYRAVPQNMSSVLQGEEGSHALDHDGDEPEDELGVSDIGNRRREVEVAKDDEAEKTLKAGACFNATDETNNTISLKQNDPLTTTRQKKESSGQWPRESSEDNGIDAGLARESAIQSPIISKRMKESSTVGDAARAVASNPNSTVASRTRKAASIQRSVKESQIEQEPHTALEQGDNNWLRRLRNRGGDHSSTFTISSVTSQQLTMGPPPSRSGQTQGDDVSPGFSYVSTLPPDSDASQDRPDLGLPKTRNGTAPFESDTPIEFPQILPVPTRSRRKLASDQDATGALKMATSEELPTNSLRQRDSMPEEQEMAPANSSKAAGQEHEVICLLSSPGLSLNGESKGEEAVGESRKRPNPATKDTTISRKARRRRRRRHSNIELLPPEIVPSISLACAAQTVDAPVWEFGPSGNCIR